MAEENRFRRNCIRVKLSDSEYDTIWQKSLASNLTLSDAIRSLIVFGCIKPDGLDEKSQVLVDKFNELLSQIVYEINRVGNNINQIAHIANTQKYVDREQIKHIVDYLDEIMEKVREIDCKQFLKNLHIHAIPLQY